MKALHRAICAFLLCAAQAAMMGCSRNESTPSLATWSPTAAAAYLDQRAEWWSHWPHALRDHGTFCVSCHTSVPYVISRPKLRAVLREPSVSSDELVLLDDVMQRVHQWKVVAPYYDSDGYDHKADESRGSEAVLNAFILANVAAQSGKLDDDTRLAFDNLWSTQQTSGDLRGAWSWLQFDQEPFEANDSAYYGATMAAIAVSVAAQNYRSTPNIQDQLVLLRDYLKREAPHQSTANRVMLLWASSKWPGLLSADEQKAIIHEALSRQQKDGGWRLSSLSWRWQGWTLKSLVNTWVREDGTPLPGKSDGYATGLIAYVLQEAGVPSNNQQLQAALAWLSRNQQADGKWPCDSVNKQHKQSSGVGLFMSDAATAFAVLALTRSDHAQTPVSNSTQSYNLASASPTKPHE